MHEDMKNFKLTGMDIFLVLDCSMQLQAVQTATASAQMHASRTRKASASPALWRRLVSFPVLDYQHGKDGSSMCEDGCSLWT